MNKNIKIVIGANAGDEGKGLATDYFASKNSNGLVILSNGGSQRGHTVELPNNIRHVFHHFGSGTLRGWDTCFSKDFIINPMQFCKEYNEIKQVSTTPFNVYCDPECMWSTPYDMLYNQILSRISGRHDTCGMGIWATIKRYRYFKDSNMVLKSIFDDHTDVEIRAIRDYYVRLVNGLSMDSETLHLIEDLCTYLLDDGILNHFLADLMAMKSIIKPFSISTLSSKYQNIIIENGQGLMIDTDKDVSFGTPSHTGLHIPVDILSQITGEKDVEVCYVSRSYLTRHGYGFLQEECEFSSINKYILDLTNQFNNFQGGLRFGKLYPHDLLRRIDDDFCKHIGYGFKKSLMLTHLNEASFDLLPIKGYFYKIYVSDTKYSDDIHEFKN